MADGDVTGEAKKERHPAVVAAAIALPIALIFGVIVGAVKVPGSHDPVSLGEVPAPDAGSQQCTDLLDRLPQRLDDYERAELADPAPAGAAVWQRDHSNDDEIVLRCGVSRPDEFDAAAALQIVNEVEWFQVSGEAQGLNSSTFFAVDRGTYTALTLPSGTGPTPIQDVSNVIKDVMAQQPIDPAPVEGPPIPEPVNPVPAPGN